MGQRERRRNQRSNSTETETLATTDKIVDTRLGGIQFARDVLKTLILLLQLAAHRKGDDFEVLKSVSDAVEMSVGRAREMKELLLLVAAKRRPDFIRSREHVIARDVVSVSLCRSPFVELFLLDPSHTVVIQGALLADLSVLQLEHPLSSVLGARQLVGQRAPWRFDAPHSSISEHEVHLHLLHLFLDHLQTAFEMERKGGLKTKSQNEMKRRKEEREEGREGRKIGKPP